MQNLLFLYWCVFYNFQTQQLIEDVATVTTEEALEVIEKEEAENGGGEEERLVTIEEGGKGLSARREGDL